MNANEASLSDLEQLELSAKDAQAVFDIIARNGASRGASDSYRPVSEAALRTLEQVAEARRAATECMVPPSDRLTVTPYPYIQVSTSPMAPAQAFAAFACSGSGKCQA